MSLRSLSAIVTDRTPAPDTDHTDVVEMAPAPFGEHPTHPTWRIA